jgi:hypothetical protein
MSQGATVVPQGDYTHVLPRVLPSDWRFLQPFGDGYAVQNLNGLRVLASSAPFEDGREWLHVSMSRKDRLPSYDDMKHVKAVFVGNDRYAIQVFPPASQHVNIHQFCLHLWCPLTGSLPFPEFGAGGTI